MMFLCPKALRLTSPGGDKWKQCHASMREKHGLGGAPEFSEKHAMVGVQTERAADIINIAFQITEKKQAGAGRTLVVDFSQNLARKPWAEESCRSLTRGSSLFLCSRGRAAVAIEHARMLGFPSTIKFGHLSSHDIRDLCGDAMGVPSVGTALLSLLCAQQQMM